MCDRCGKDRPDVVLLAISRDMGIKRIETRTRRCDDCRDLGLMRCDRVRTIKSFHHYDTDQSGVRGA